MYLYSFIKFAGPDKVFTVPKGNVFCKKAKIGDLVIFGENVFLCLGDEISFAEQYVYPYVPKEECGILYKKLLSEKAVAMIHRMVYTYYTTYKSVIKYFVSDEWETLLKKEVKRGTGNGKRDQEFVNRLPFTVSPEGQTLIVFPDLRTIMNTIDAKILEDKDVAFLSSTSSQGQKDKQRWAIKKGTVNQIFASPSEIFQDFHDLKKIIFIDPHKWYYANQQDPRYKVGAVLEEMAKVYGAELEILGK